MGEVCTPRSSFVVRGLAFLSALALLLPSVEVGADQFQPEGDPPVVGVPVLSVQDASPGTFEQFEPADPRSDDAYFLDMTIGTPSETSSLDAVVVCLYLPGVHDPDDESDPACDPDRYERSSDPEPLDPTTMLLMVWDRDGVGSDEDGTFRMVGDNQHALHPLDGSDDPAWVSGWDDGSALSLDLRFGFKVSGAMRHANDWALRVDATAGATGTRLVEDLAVAYFGAITTDRPTINFGPVRAGEPVERIAPAGRYRANSRSLQTIWSTSLEFQPPGGAPSITLPLLPVPGATDRGIGSGAGAPGPGSSEATLDCSSGSSFDASLSVRVDSTAQIFRRGLGPVGEEEIETGDHTCRISYGGGIDRANVTLSNTIEVAIGADEPSPSALSVTESGTTAELSWAAPDDVTVRSYVIEVGDPSGTSFSPALRIDGAVTTATLTGLDRDALYAYRVTANTDVGAGSVTENGMAQVPTAPRGLSVAESDDSIAVTWQAPEGDGGSEVTKYRVRVFDTMSEEVQFREVDAPTTTATFTTSDLDDGTYTFTVEAVNTAGTSEATSPSAAATLATIQPFAETFSAGTGRTGSFQTLTVPNTGNYVLEIDGAQGGGTYGGRGARITATFQLDAGDELIIMVGHRGGSITGAAGGGGASAVWRRAGGTGTATLLAIAGGGGGVTGENVANRVASADASTTEDGNPGSATSSWFLAAGGVNGQSGGGTQGTGGAGGGGGTELGRPDRFDGRNAGRITSSLAAGGSGGTDGGFGAGGGATNNGTSFLGGGGGGGFSGGGGASSANGAAANGGGGGSWVAGTSEGEPEILSGPDGNTGAGSVTVRTPGT